MHLETNGERGSLRRLLVVLLVGVGSLFALALPAQDDWRLPGLDGGELTPADLERGSTVLVVWTTWSPRCRDIVERVNRIVDRWQEEATVVTVDFQEEAGEVESFLSGKSLDAPVYLDRDGAFSKQHRQTNLPGLVVYHQGEATYEGKFPEEPDEVIAEALK